MVPLMLFLLFTSFHTEGSKLDAPSSFCSQVIFPHGHNCTEHTVQTDDGFVLSFQSLPSKNNKNDNSVLFVHPNLWSGDIWFRASQSYTPAHLPFLLLEKGFNVWIANLRASFWSQENINYSPNQTEYWQWTWDDCAKSDFFSISNYIQAVSRGPFHVIGFDYGASIALAGATLGVRVDSLVMIAPTVFLGHANSSALLEWAYLIGPITDERYILEGYNNGAFNLSAESGNDTSLNFTTSSSQSTIENIYGPLCCIPEGAMKSLGLSNNGWDGVTSFVNLEHAQQDVRSNRFQMFDYSNSIMNLAKYGAFSPPLYDIRRLKWKLPVMIVHGGQDWYSSDANVATLVKSLYGVALLTVLRVENYSHFDLLFSSSVEEDVFSAIGSFLE